MNDQLLTRLKPFDLVAFRKAQENDGSMTLSEAIATLQGETLIYSCPQCLGDDDNNNGYVSLEGLDIVAPCPTCLGMLKTDVPYVLDTTKFQTYTALTINGDVSVAVSETIQLTASVLKGTYATGDAGIATVNNHGVVTGVSEGTVTITYTVSDVEATKDIEVTA